MIRLVAFLLFLLPSFLPNTALADYAATPIWRSYNFTANSGTFHTSFALACDKTFVDYKAYWPSKLNPWIVTPLVEPTCKINYQGSSYGNPDFLNLTQYKDCGSGNVLWSALPGNGICSGTPPPVVCTAPLVRDPATNTCVPVPCVDGQTVSEGPYGSNNNPTVICLNNCEALKVIDGAPYVDCTVASGAALGTCLYYYPAHYVTTGVSCSPDTSIPSQASQSPNSCAECNCMEQGQSYGTVNGVVVCVPKGTAGSAPVSTTTPGTTSTQTPAPTPENPNPTPVTVTGPSVTVTVTPPPAGAPAGSEPTVTETKTNADGSTISKGGQKGDFCSENPSSKLCAAQTACQENAEGPECKHFCEKYPDTIACKKPTDFIKEIIGDPSTIDNAANPIGEKTIEPYSFSAVPITSNSGCPAPITVSFAGHAVTISYQWLCDYASAFKPLVIAFATFFAGMMLLGGVRSNGSMQQGSLF